jgi:O-antigen/teichoic acid export membrane protein
MRFVDLLVRLFPSYKRSLAWAITHVHPPDLRKRMISFAWQSVTSMIVALIVWDRCEILLLSIRCSDSRQISFYSVAFTMAGQLLIGATIFSAAASTTIFAQFGRDKSRLPDITASSFRYLALISIPLHFISTALAVPAMLLLFGHKYEGAAMVVMLAPLLCMSKAFVVPVGSLLESMEQQRFVIAATVLAAIIDIGVAWWLIPAHGAVGACIGNGAAQFTAVGLMWAVAIHHYKVKLPWLQVAKISFISVLASLTAHFIAVRLAPLWAVLCGGSAALIVFFALLYLMRVLEPEDRVRFVTVSGMLPKIMATPAKMVLNLLIRPV